MRDLVLIGAGGTAADVLAIVEAINARGPQYRCLGLLDDAPQLEGQTRYGLPILGPLSDGSRFGGAFFLDCLGSPRSYPRRETLLAEKGIPAQRFETLVHPTAVIAGTCRIGVGCIIYPNVVLMANVTLGIHVTVLANSVMNHEVEVGDFSIVTSGVNLSGRVRVGRACYLGTGSAVIQDVQVGDGALVGMGSVVIDDVPAGAVVAGNPARPLRGSGG
jgi:sugar O-acyltransferase (sialic acid O-acetyltransferase NeuD family)